MADKPVIAEPVTEPKRGPVANRSSFITRPVFAVPASALVVLLIALVVMQQVGGPKAGPPNDLTGGVRVTSVPAGSFGSLVSGSAPTAESGMRNLAGGGGMGVPASAGDASKISAMPVPGMMGVPETSPGVSEPDARMIYPYEQPTVFTYAYKGNLNGLLEAELPVLRRIKGERKLAFGDTLAAALPDVFDFSAISDLKVQNFSAFQDKPYGLSLYADMTEETVSIGQYYPLWPHPEQTCRDQDCYENFRLRESDMLSDQEAIALADSFLNELGISRADYGQPEVRADWQRWLAMTAVRSDFWFPESISVVYPLLVDGISAVDESGYALGLGVNVNIREERADSVWNLQSRNYESAMYEAMTDEAQIIAAAARGGVWGYVPQGGEEVIEISLGTPTRVLLRTWQYSGDGTSKELLAPGLRFPVEDPDSATHGTPAYVTVPLIKEFFDQSPGYGGGPVIMMRDGAGTAGSGTVSSPPSEPAPAPVPLY